MSHTFVVRTFNSERTLEACLSSVRSQTVAAEIIVVDSGSSDGTLTIAQRFADKMIHLAREEFSYGRALNAGFAEASGAIVHALSSHCILPSRDHTALVDDIHDDLSVVATNGQINDPWGHRIQGVYMERHWPSSDLFTWGFSNHSSSIRRSIWEVVNFDETLAACEDLDWAHRVFAARPGSCIAYSPKLYVTADHRLHATLSAAYGRGYKEGCALQTILSPRQITTRDIIRHLWDAVGEERRAPKLVYRLYPHRVVETAGMWRGVQKCAAARSLGASEP